MQLKYRGISYNYNPPEVIYGPVFAQGHYRGHAISLRNPDRLPVEQPILELKYRNVTYTTQPAVRSPEQVASAPLESAWVDAETAIAPTAVTTTTTEQPPLPAPRVDTTIAERARALMIQHHVKVLRREEGMLSRVFSEIGLPVEQASHPAGRIQGKIHSSYWASYDRSHASMS